MQLGATVCTCIPVPARPHRVASRRGFTLDLRERACGQCIAVRSSSQGTSIVLCGGSGCAPAAHRWLILRTGLAVSAQTAGGEKTLFNAGAPAAVLGCGNATLSRCNTLPSLFLSTQLSGLTLRGRPHYSLTALDPDTLIHHRQSASPRSSSEQSPRLRARRPWYSHKHNHLTTTLHVHV